jgi:hypothetical protein
LSDRSGCSLIELTVLGVLDDKTAGRPRAHVQSAKVLDGIDDRIGLGPRYAYELLLDLARPWITPIPLLAVEGNAGDRSGNPSADPEYTRCRPSRAGRLVLEAEAHRLAPVPIGLINGTTYRGGTRPPLDPFAVLAALRRLLEDPGVPDGELVSMTGPPWSGTDCDLSGDLAALARGRPVVLRESGRITTTGVPVPQEPADGQPASAQGDQHALVEISGQPLPGEPFPGEPFPAHLVIESLPARTDTSAVAAEIASRAERRQWHGPHADLARRTALPVYYVDDQSKDAEVRILVTLYPNSDPTAVRDQLTTIRGISAETPCAFPAPLASLLRSWVDDHRGENMPASLTELDDAIRHDRQRGASNR